MLDRLKSIWAEAKAEADKQEFVPELPPAKIKARAQMAGTKIHGPNSPLVISGEVPLGHNEVVDFINGASDQIVELDYEQCVELFGREHADILFRGVK